MKLEGPDACLAYLILNQAQWQPKIELLKRGNGSVKAGTHLELVGVVVTNDR